MAGFNPKDFAQPIPSRLVMSLMNPVNRYLILQGVPGLRRLPLLWQLPLIRDLPGPGSTAKVRTVDFPGSEIAKFKQYINPHTAAFIGPNHPEFWTDWSLDKYFSEHVSPQMSHWAWYGTVNANPFMQGFWLRNNLISNAPNGKEEAKRYAIDWVKKGYGNLLHPEGSVHWTADKVQTIFGGIIDMSLRTSRELIDSGDPRPVYAVPMLSKYFFVEDVSAALMAEISQIEGTIGLKSDQRESLEDRFFSLQQRILARQLTAFDSASASVTITPQNLFTIQLQFQEELLSRLRAFYGQRSGDMAAQLRAYEKEIKLLRPPKGAPKEDASGRRYRDETKLVAEIRRLETFQADVYATETLTQEQIAETLKRTKRDLVNKTSLDGLRNVLPVAAGWRTVILRCGDPINVRERLEQHRGELRELSDELLVEFRRRMQAKLDELVAMSKPVTNRFSRPNPFAAASTASASPKSASQSVPLLKANSMHSQTEVESQVQSDPESAVNLDYGLSDARASLPAATSLLELSPAHAEYARRLESIVARAAPLQQVLEWDRTKMPPLPVLRAMVDEGIFVSGVPIPDAALARDYAAQLVRAEVISADIAQRLDSPASSRDQSQQEFLKSLGRDGHARAMGVAAQATARLGGVGIGTFMGVSTGLSAQTIYRVGTLAQQSFWLNALNRGIFTYAFGLTEKNAGSDPRSMTTTFLKETDAHGHTVYRLNGDKKFIGNAARVVDAAGNVVHRGADFLLVFAVDDPAKPPKDRVFHCFLVPRSRIGEDNIRHTGGEWNKTGLREVNNGNFDLRDCLVPECCVLGTPGENMYPKLLGTLDVTRFLVGAMGVGTAESALDVATRYAAERNQNGIPISRYPMISYPLRELAARVLVGKLLVQEAATLVDQADRDRHSLSATLAAALAIVSDMKQLLEQLFAIHSAKDIQHASREALAACETALNEESQRLKLSERKKTVDEAIHRLQTQTRKLRDEAAAEAVSLAKAIYRDSLELTESLKDAAEPTRFGTETAMAKLYGSELAQQTIYQARQTLGGNGYLENPEEGLGLGKRSRDAEVLTIYEGQSNIQRGIIAQGILMQQIKKVQMPLLAPGSIWQKLNFLLLNSRLTKETHYKILMSTSRTPVERTNAAFKYAVVDVMGKYNDSLQAVKKKWSRDGIPPEYRHWDEGSLERQQNMLAANPIQARLALLADIAVYRKLIHLASRERERCQAAPAAHEQLQHHLQLLGEFLVLGVERVLELVNRLSGDYLTLLDQQASGLKAFQPSPSHPIQNDN